MNNYTEIKPGFKPSPLGPIPVDWGVKKLGELVEIYSGVSPAQFTLANSGKYPYLKVEDLNNCEKYQFLSREYSDDEKVLVPKNSVIFPKRGAAILNNKVRINTVIVQMDSNLMAVSPISIVLHHEYLFYRLVFEKLFKIADTSTIPQINNKHIIPHLFPLPPLPEQQKIAAILSTWDDAISKTQQLIAQLKERNRGLQQLLLSSKKRIKGFNNRWKPIRLRDAFERVTRKNDEINTNVVTISAQRGFVRQDDFFKKIIASEILDNYFLVYKGEFCYNKSYSNGYPWGATKRLNDFDKAVVTTLYICFRIKDDAVCSADFFEHFFENGALDEGLAKVAHEGGRAHGLLNVTPSDFFNLRINIPSIEEQDVIAKILTSANIDITIHEQKLAALKQQKKGLMQKLLMGEKRVII